MAWTSKEQEKAATEGWGVFTVFDNVPKAVPYQMVLGLGEAKAVDALRHVVTYARRGSDLHQLALAEVMRTKAAKRKK